MTFLVPIVAIMSLPEWQCPSEEQMIASRTDNTTGPITNDEWTHLWQSRIREVHYLLLRDVLRTLSLRFNCRLFRLLHVLSAYAVADKWSNHNCVHR